MGELNSGSRTRKRKGSNKSSTKSNKRRASIEVKLEPIVASPVSLPKELELPKTEISPPQDTLLDDHQQPTQSILGTPIINSLSKNFTKNLTNIPNEIFVQICAHLPPSDLLSLTLVCKKLNELLSSPNSEQTQAIWRTSRLRFLRFFQLNPPNGLDEKSYIVLRQLENGCQICHHGIGEIKVYWEFFVRCCEACLHKNTTRRDTLFIDLDVPDEVLRTLPYTSLGASQIYWSKEVDRVHYEYYQLRDEEIPFWVEHGEIMANRIMQEAVLHEQEEHEEQISKLEERLARSPNDIQPIPQQQIFIRQPQFTNAPMNFVSMSSMTNMSPTSVTNMSPVPTIPSMQFQQFNRSQMIIPQVQGVIPFNRSQLMIPTPPAQQFYSHPHFVPRITRQLISQQQMIPSHMMSGTPHMLTPQLPQILTPRLPHVLTPQMVSPHCYGIHQLRRI